MKLKEENVIIKELFNFNGGETKLKHLKKSFINFIKISKSEPNFFVNLLYSYSKCRPNQQYVSRELVECIYFCFPEKMNEIQQKIKRSPILNFIIFPEEFPIKESEPQKEMFLLLQKDDIDGFISFLSNNPTIDITKKRG